MACICCHHTPTSRLINAVRMQWHSRARTLTKDLIAAKMRMRQDDDVREILDGNNVGSIPWNRIQFIAKELQITIATAPFVIGDVPSERTTWNQVLRTMRTLGICVMDIVVNDDEWKRPADFVLSRVAVKDESEP